MNRRKAHPKKAPSDRYTTHSLGVAITRACERAGVRHWHPNQIRHAFASEVRKVHGLEAAQVLLGHSKADVTQVYAERNLELAVKVAREVG
jgi:integrase